MGSKDASQDTQPIKSGSSMNVTLTGVSENIAKEEVFTMCMESSVANCGYTFAQNINASKTRVEICDGFTDEKLRDACRASHARSLARSNATPTACEALEDPTKIYLCKREILFEFVSIKKDPRLCTYFDKTPRPTNILSELPPGNDADLCRFQMVSQMIGGQLVPFCE